MKGGLIVFFAVLFLTIANAQAENYIIPIDTQYISPFDACTVYKVNYDDDLVSFKDTLEKIKVDGRNSVKGDVLEYNIFVRTYIKKTLTKPDKRNKYYLKKGFDCIDQGFNDYNETHCFLSELGGYFEYDILIPEWVKISSQNNLLNHIKYQGKIDSVYDAVYSNKKDIEIKICGKIDPVNMGYEIDHYPFFDDKVYYEYAWWNSSWDFCRNIDINKPAGDFNATYPIFNNFQVSDFGANFNVTQEFFENYNSTRLRIINEYLNKSMNVSVIKANSTEFIIAFDIDETTDQNITYQICYGNPSASFVSNTDMFMFVDTFEDANISDWTLYNNGNISIDSNITIGGYSLHSRDSGGAPTDYLTKPLNMASLDGLAILFYNYAVDYRANSVLYSGGSGTTATIDSLGLSNNGSCRTTRHYDGSTDIKGNICYPVYEWNLFEARNIRESTKKFDIYVNFELDTKDATMSTRNLWSNLFEPYFDSNHNYFQYWDNIIIYSYDLDSENFTITLGSEIKELNYDIDGNITSPENITYATSTVDAIVAFNYTVNGTYYLNDVLQGSFNEVTGFSDTLTGLSLGSYNFTVYAEAFNDSTETWTESVFYTFDFDLDLDFSYASLLSYMNNIYFSGLSNTSFNLTTIVINGTTVYNSTDTGTSFNYRHYHGLSFRDSADFNVTACVYSSINSEVSECENEYIEFSYTYSSLLIIIYTTLALAIFVMFMVGMYSAAKKGDMGGVGRMIIAFLAVMILLAVFALFL